MQYQCSGVQCQATFSSFLQHETAIGVALQVAFIAAHATYQKLVKNTFGMYAVSDSWLHKTLEKMYPHIKSTLDEQCDLAKQQVKAKPAIEVGSFVTTADDGAWLIRGHHFHNFTYQVRDYQRGRDGVCDDGTSKSAEGSATSIGFANPKEDVSIHWTDKDSSSALAIREHYPAAKLMLCSDHAACAHEKTLKNESTVPSCQE